MDDLGTVVPIPDVEGVSAVPAGAVRLLEARPEGEDVVGLQAGPVDKARAPETRHPHHKRMVVPKRALAHQRMGNRKVHVLNEPAQLLAGPREQDAAADIGHRRLRLGQRPDDLPRGVVVQGGLLQRARVLRHPLEAVRGDALAEDVHRDIHQHRSRLPAFGHVERLFEDFRHEFGAVNPPGPLDEGAVDFPLGRIGVKVDLLVRVLAVVVGRDVARDDHHRDAVKRGIRHACRAIRQARRKMAQHHGRPALNAGIPIRRMAGDLLVPDGDELDGAVGHRRQNRDVGVSAEAEDVPHLAPLEEIDDMLGDGPVLDLPAVHHAASLPWNSPKSSSSGGRSSGMGRETQV